MHNVPTNQATLLKQWSGFSRSNKLYSPFKYHGHGDSLVVRVRDHSIQCKYIWVRQLLHMRDKSASQAQTLMRNIYPRTVLGADVLLVEEDGLERKGGRGFQTLRISTSSKNSLTSAADAPATTLNSKCHVQNTAPGFLPCPAAHANSAVRHD